MLQSSDIDEVTSAADHVFVDGRLSLSKHGSISVTEGMLLVLNNGDHEPKVYGFVGIDV